MQFEDISYNFSVAKVFSILMVATGHYFGSILWIPTTVALFIFAFSSGFFTASKYSGEFSKTVFWHAKVERLAYALFVINIFLLLLFLLQQRDGILSWQTILCLFGLNGFLDWFAIPKETPFGAGLWFFTLLWLFYLLYPVLERLNRERVRASLFVTLSLVVFSSMHYLLPMGHMLWMTAFAFAFGVYSARFRMSIPPAVSLSLLVGSAAFMAIFRLYWDTNIFNFFGILLCSVATVYLLLNYRLPNKLLEKSLVLSGCVMEIYFIHTYLSVKTPNCHGATGYVSSIAITIATALLLNKGAEKLSLAVKSR